MPVGGVHYVCTVPAQILPAILSQTALYLWHNAARQRALGEPDCLCKKRTMAALPHQHAQSV